MTNEYADETMSKVSFDPLASSDPSLPSVNVTREPVNFGRDNKCMKRGALLPEDPPAVDPTEFSSGADLRSSFLFQSSCFLSDGDCTSSGSSLDSSGKSPKPLKSFKKKNVQFNDDLSVCEEGKDDSSSALHGAFRIVVPAILTPSSSSSLPQPPPPPLLLGSVPLDDTTNGDVFTYHQSRAGVSTLTDDDAFYTWQKTRKHRYICLTLVSLFFICCLSVIVTCASGNCNPSRQNQENLQANAPSQVPQDDADMLPTSLRPTISPTIHYNAFESIDELYDAVDSFMENPNNPELLEKYGRIKYWNIAMVSNLAELFSAKRNSLSVNFNEDISRWNTSMVTNMTRLFEGARSFDQNLSLWETCNVRGMRETFSGATQFQGMGLAHWNVSNVDDTTGMFRSAYAFNEDISNWEVELVTSLAEMFLEALSFNQSLKAWNTKSATNMSSMFANAPLFSGDLSSFDTSKVIDMSSMFRQVRIGLGGSPLIHSTNKLNTFLCI
jgi:surface protein